MKYSINDLDRLSVEKLCAGLAELPFKDVYQLLPYIQGQVSLQDQAANQPTELNDVAGDADELIAQ